MALPKGFEVFPADYDELEIHVAGLCACVDFAGDPDAAVGGAAGWAYRVTCRGRSGILAY